MPELGVVSKQRGSPEPLDAGPLNATLQCQESQKQNMLLLQVPKKQITLATLIYCSMKEFYYHFFTEGYQIL